jgi:hypothetical protein
VLVALVDSGGFVSKAQLMEKVWPDSFVEEANIHHNISILRKALGKEGRWIATVHRQGYRLMAEVSRLASPNRSPSEVDRSEQGNGHAETAARALLEGLGLALGGVVAAMAEIRVRPGRLTLEIEIPGLQAVMHEIDSAERLEDQEDPKGARPRARMASAD